VDSLLTNEASLPRLLYLGDVPVERGLHGSALLYRLLEVYPKNKLLIVEGSRKSNLTLQLSGVQYHGYKQVWSRLLQTRFHSYASSAATLCAPMRGRPVPDFVLSFRPQAVFTVVWGYVWAAAAAYAERANLPLHLVVHDDWLNVEARLALERRLIDQRLRYWYPKAASRLCVSPYMAEAYCRRYGAAADVLYPSCAADVPIAAEPPVTLRGACDPFTVAFAGTIHLDYPQALSRMATALRCIGGRLIVYGPEPHVSARSMLEQSNIEMRGKVSSPELIRQCRTEAHAMFVPMSFDEQDRSNMETSFPSKLADSTAVGIPVVIHGPEYCSAVRWAFENPGVAEVVTEATVNALVMALARLRDPTRRLQLAGQAIFRCKQYFAHARAVSLIYSQLSESISRRRLPAGP
jgi:hypothetical protein